MELGRRLAASDSSHWFILAFIDWYTAARGGVFIGTLFPPSRTPDALGRLFPPATFKGEQRYVAPLERTSAPRQKAAAVRGETHD